MEYKGYQILAEIRQWQEYEFEEDKNGKIYITYIIRQQSGQRDLDRSDVKAWLVYSIPADDEYPEILIGCRSLKEAKNYIDQLVKEQPQQKVESMAYGA